MRNFEFRKIKAVTGRRCEVLQLSINGINQLDEFEAGMEKEYESQYKMLLAYIDHYSNTGKIPGDKMKEITAKKSQVKEFEFRTKNGIRLYAVQSKEGRIILLCGYKGSQNEDIPRFRQLAKTIFENR